MELHLKIIGVLLMVLSFAHAFFPRYFNWKAEQASLSLMNRQMMQVHVFFIALILFGMGVLCLSSSQELMGTSLGKKLSLGLGIFWSIRLFFQFFVYSPKLWKGKTFETVVHIVFSLFWAYLSIVFFLVYKII